MPTDRSIAKRSRVARPLYLQLVLVALAFALMIVSSCLFVDNMLSNYLDRDAVNVLTQTKLMIESELIRPETTLAVISYAIRSTILQGGGEEAVLEYMRNITDEMQSKTSGFIFDGIYGYFDVFGGKYLYAGWDPPPGYDPTTRPWYQTGIEAGDKVTITSIYTNLRFNEYSITYVLRIFDDEGTPLGMVCLNAQLDQIRKIVADIRLAEGSYGILLDENLDIFYHPEQGSIGKNMREINYNYSVLADETAEGRDLFERAVKNSAGQLEIVFSTRLDNGWVLDVVTPKAEYYKELRDMEKLLSILGALLAAILIAVLIRVDRAKNKLFEENQQKSMMLASMEKELEAEERTRLMLDTSPLCVCVFDREHRNIDCNQEAVKLFEAKSKQEYIERFWEFQPEYQPDGSKSIDKAKEIIDNAYEEGLCRFEWILQKLDGEPVPCEVTLVRVRYKDDYIVFAYMRDLRSHKQMMGEIERRDSLLHTVNLAATAMLSIEDDDRFDDSLLSGMELMGLCMGVDRVQIWQNETIDEELYFVHKYEWLSDTGRQKPPVPIGLKFSYTEKTEWKEMFMRNEYINSPLRELPLADRELLDVFEIQSIVIIPLFLHNQFWGFFSLDDCCRERVFTEEEIDILRSASLMMANAVNRRKQAAMLREADELTLLMLDAMPFSCTLWDRNIKNMSCNQAAVNLFKVAGKQDFTDRFDELSPEYQPCGMASKDMMVVNLNKAFEEGYNRFEWLHRTSDGELIPSEVTLVRIKHKD